MTLEVLLSCMYQQDDQLVRDSRLTGNVVIINQCNHDGYDEFPTQTGIARMFSTKDRGLSKSRNMAIRNAAADICLLCDDDEEFLPGYEENILKAYETLSQADIIIFKMANRKPSFQDKVMRLHFPWTMRVCSWQISFRTKKLRALGIQFDELLGAGTGNGAEEELNFLLDCERAGLKIYYVPIEIASVAQIKSTWFHGYTERYFENRGATTRYILGTGIACVYAVYFIITKRSLYQDSISPSRALRATFRGIWNNKIGKQAKIKV